MMHGFALSLGMLWWIVPVAIAFLAVPTIRRFVTRHSRERRIDGHQPAALPTSSEARIFRLARRMDGRLTVSDVVVETGLGAQEAESLLQSLVDGIRVQMEVQPTGTVYYEFMELRGDRS